jgi:4'-phosphopantetheinyl transferase
MPLHKIIHHDVHTRVSVWKITESYNELFRAVALKDISLARLEGMKSESHQKGFLAVRMLLQEAGYNDYDLYYDEFGKPHLKDGRHISISHSFEFSVIILSNQNIGVDLELRRDKIEIIAEKFAAEDFIFQCRDNKSDYVSKLTVIWGVKEAVFKIRNEVGISFKDHIFVAPFEMNEGKGKAMLHFNAVEQEFEMSFEEIESYTLVWVFEKK